MQSIRLLALSCFALLLTGGTVLADAKDDAQKALLGKWGLKQKMGDIEITGELEFAKDGKLNMKVKAKDMELKFDGSYKILSDTEMEVSVSFMGTNKTEKTKFKVTGDTLEMTDKEGKVEKFTRVK